MTTLEDLTVGLVTCDDDPIVLASALEAIASQGLVQPVVVVDMSRGDDVRRLAEGRCGFRYVAFPESLGTSDSRNRLVAVVETRYLLSIDADAVPTSGWARAMRAAFEREPDAAIVGARCLPVWPRARPPLLFGTQPALDFLGMYDLGTEPRAVPRIMGTSYAMDLERLPDPAFRVDVGRRPGSFLAGEEVVLCRSVKDAGWRVVYEPAAIVRHHVRAGRDSWGWMLHRVRIAGRESRLYADRPEPIPRRMSLTDRVFQAAVMPAFLLGALEGPRGQDGAVAL